MSTPGFTLTATLQTIAGGAAGTAANPAKLVIVLRGYPLALPSIAGTSTLAQLKYEVLATSSAAVTQLLWGNDQIAPGTTYYSITVVDGAGNVVQTANYLLTGSGGDLSSLTPITPGYPVPISALAVLPCTGAVPGTAYMAPGTVIAVLYNGVVLPPGLALPTLSYTLGGPSAITLNFTTDVDDLIYALVVT